MVEQHNKETRKNKIHHLEIHVSHGCNLRCANCSHYCNIGYSQEIDHDMALESIKEWGKRLVINQFALLGGEPLIEKRLPEYIRTAAETFPYAERRVVTNGLLLSKWGNDLPKIIKETDTRLIVSLHNVSEIKKEALRDGVSILKEWIKKYNLNATIKPVDSRWFKIYKNDGVEILPFSEGNPAKSRKVCVTPCVNIHNNMLWKCPPLAYLPMIIDKLKYREQWVPYLAYEPISLSATYNEIEKLNTDTCCCDMCPISPALDEVQYSEHDI